MIKKGMLGALAMYSLAAQMSSDITVFDDRNEYQQPGKSNPDIFTEPDVKPYKGQKEYHFNQSGMICYEKDSETVFSCFAINTKNAIKKFKQFLTH